MAAVADGHGPNQGGGGKGCYHLLDQVEVLYLSDGLMANDPDGTVGTSDLFLGYMNPTSTWKIRTAQSQ